MTVAAERRHDADAWAATTRSIRAFVAGRVGWGDVDDITQDILVRILRSDTPAVTAHTSPAWLFTVARNAVIDHYRTRRAVTTALGDPDTLPEPHDEAQPHEALQEAARCLRPAVATLPDRYRQAVELVDLDGMTQVAAASLVGISVPGMKSRVQRGRRMLAETLATWCRVYLDESGLVASDPCVTGCDDGEC